MENLELVDCTKVFMDLEFDMKKGGTTLLSIGAVKIDDEFNTIEEFHSYIALKDGVKINPYVSGLTGITEDTLLGAPNLREVIINFNSWLNDYRGKLYVWGDCDGKVIGDVLNELDLIDKYRYMRDNIFDLQDEICPELNLISNVGVLSLESLKSIYGLDGEVKHNALSDSIDLKNVYEKYKTTKPEHLKPKLEQYKNNEELEYKSRVKYVQDIFNTLDIIHCFGLSVKNFKKVLSLIKKKVSEAECIYDFEHINGDFFNVINKNTMAMDIIDISRIKYVFRLQNNNLLKINLVGENLNIDISLSVSIYNISLLYGIIKPIYKGCIYNTLDIPEKYKGRFYIPMIHLKDEMEYLVTSDKIVPAKGSSPFEIYNTDLVFKKDVEINSESNVIKKTDYELILKDNEDSIVINIKNNIENFDLSVPKKNINKKVNKDLIWSIVSRKFRGCPIPIKSFNLFTQNNINKMIKTSKALSNDNERILIQDGKLKADNKVKFKIKKITLDYVNNMIIFTPCGRKNSKVIVNLSSIRGEEFAKNLIFNFMIEQKLYLSENNIKSSSELHKKIRGYFKTVNKLPCSLDHNISFTQYGINISKKHAKTSINKISLDSVTTILEFKKGSCVFDLLLDGGKNKKKLKYCLNIESYMGLIDKIKNKTIVSN